MVFLLLKLWGPVEERKKYENGFRENANKNILVWMGPKLHWFLTLLNNLLGDQIIDINGNRVSECPIEKIKDIIRSSPEYILCTVKPVTHYANHEDSPPTGHTAYTEVDPEELQRSDGEEEENSNYTTVEISAQSMEDLCRMDSSEDEISKPENRRTHNNSESHSTDNKTGTGRKQTNYAELEFGSR